MYAYSGETGLEPCNSFDLNFFRPTDQCILWGYFHFNPEIRQVGELMGRRMLHMGKTGCSKGQFSFFSSTTTLLCQVLFLLLDLLFLFFKLFFFFGGKGGKLREDGTREKEGS